MTHTSKTLLFFGNERLVSGLEKTNAPILTSLLKDGYIIKAIISHHNETKSRNRRPLEVAQIGEAHNIPVLLPDRPTDIIDQISDLDVNAAVLVAYGRIIPQRIIDLFPRGIINVHPSLLPKYRGPTPIESTISAGDVKTGLSIMQLTAGMDTGPIYGQVEIELSGNETKFDVYDQLAPVGVKLLLKLLPSILDGSLRPRPQDNSQASYSQLLTKKDAWLDTNSLTAAQAERLVRAHLGFPKTKLSVAGHDIVITKAHISPIQKTPLDILCQDGAYLSIDELVAPSGRRMNSDAFLRGYAASV